MRAVVPTSSVKTVEKMSKPFADAFLFDGSQSDIDAQLEEQDAFIDRYGPISVEVLGIGMNGHLGFNEDGVDFHCAPTGRR